MKYNIKAFKELTERYESITIEEIKDGFKEHIQVKKELTGFGSRNTCPLCREANEIANHPSILNHMCKYCIWVLRKNDDIFKEHNVFCTEEIKFDRNSCMKGMNRKTFQCIQYAKNPTELFSAYKERAKRMHDVLVEIGEL